MRVELKNLDELEPLSIEDNPRMHPQVQIDEFVRSLEKFGQVRPMVVDENNKILIGNGLYRALIQMGEEKGSVLVVDSFTEAEKQKLVIADNKIYELGTTNSSVLLELLPSLRGGEEFDIPGFKEEILQGLYPPRSPSEDDTGAEVEKEIPSDSPPAEEEVKLQNKDVKVDENHRPFIICHKCSKKVWL